MEDALEQLDRLARSVGECTRCADLAACRLRAVPGEGHPHCTVMVVSLHPSLEDEEAGKPAGSTVLQALADYMPALRTSAELVYVTTLMKCVPRSGCDARAATAAELDACYPFLSRELTITTPHYVLAIGEETTGYLLDKMFKHLPYEQGESLELRIFDNPAFKIVPVATPEELAARDAKTQKAYAESLHALARKMGLQAS